MCDGIIRPSSRTYLCTFSNPSTITDAVLPGCRIPLPRLWQPGHGLGIEFRKGVGRLCFPEPRLWSWLPLKYAKGWILELGAKYILVRRLRKGLPNLDSRVLKYLTSWTKSGKVSLSSFHHHCRPPTSLLRLAENKVVLTLLRERCREIRN